MTLESKLPYLVLNTGYFTTNELLTVSASQVNFHVIKFEIRGKKFKITQKNCQLPHSLQSALGFFALRHYIFFLEISSFKASKNQPVLYYMGRITGQLFCPTNKQLHIFSRSIVALVLLPIPVAS